MSSTHRHSAPAWGGSHRQLVHAPEDMMVSSWGQPLSSCVHVSSADQTEAGVLTVPNMTDCDYTPALQAAPCYTPLISRDEHDSVPSFSLATAHTIQHQYASSGSPGSRSNPSMSPRLDVAIDPATCASTHEHASRDQRAAERCSMLMPPPLTPSPGPSRGYSVQAPAGPVDVQHLARRAESLYHTARRELSDATRSILAAALRHRASCSAGVVHQAARTPADAVITGLNLSFSARTIQPQAQAKNCADGFSTTCALEFDGGTFISGVEDCTSPRSLVTPETHTGTPAVPIWSVYPAPGTSTLAALLPPPEHIMPPSVRDARFLSLYTRSDATTAAQAAVPSILPWCPPQSPAPCWTSSVIAAASCGAYAVCTSTAHHPRELLLRTPAWSADLQLLSPVTHRSTPEIAVLASPGAGEGPSTYIHAPVDELHRQVHQRKLFRGEHNILLNRTQSEAAVATDAISQRHLDSAGAAGICHSGTLPGQRSEPLLQPASSQDGKLFREMEEHCLNLPTKRARLY